jgi:superfamily I DNA/RNA helicase
LSHINKIFGPPGSGKTTYLLDVVQKELTNGISPLSIGYFSFTKKAANEARTRAIEKFPLLNAKSVIETSSITIKNACALSSNYFLIFVEI